MQTELIKGNNKKPIGKILVVRNFRTVIENHDIRNMNNKLYQFLNLYCGFIAHYDINGFKATYSDPDDFANVFIRHFDKEHRYFNGCYPCHDESYKDSGYTKADVKREFARIVEKYKQYIIQWAKNFKRDELYRIYVGLRNEFERDASIQIKCDACENDYSVLVRKEGIAFTDFSEICCIFCGQQIKIYKEMEVIACGTNQQKSN